MTALAELPPILTVEEAAKFLRIGRSAAYDAVRRGDLPSVRIGRSLRVPRHQLEALLGLSNGHDPAEDRVAGDNQPLEEVSSCPPAA
jgi:excisionase family DNA binding protein